MGMRDDVATVPDIYALPVYRPTKIIKERVGDEVRMLCGYEMFGQTIYTHITILSARAMMLLGKEAEAMIRDGKDLNIKNSVGH